MAISLSICSVSVRVMRLRPIETYWDLPNHEPWNVQVISRNRHRHIKQNHLRLPALCLSGPCFRRFGRPSAHHFKHTTWWQRWQHFQSCFIFPNWWKCIEKSRCIPKVIAERWGVPGYRAVADSVVISSHLFVQDVKGWVWLVHLYQLPKNFKARSKLGQESLTCVLFVS